MLKEFREFALRGNILDLAVAVIIGGAFNGIIKSLVDDIIMAALSVVTGRIDFSNLFIALNGVSYDTLAQAEADGVAIIKYGSFISGVINFLIVAFVVFLVVKFANKLKKEAPAAEVSTKECRYCLSEINIRATKCPHCTSEVD